MTRVTLTPLANLSNGTTATTTINANSTTLNNTFDRVLWLDGTAPNQMQAALDMNTNQIINLPPPATMNSPARLVDVASNPTITVPGTGTSGHLVPFLDGTNTWAGAGSNNFLGSVSFVNGSVAGAAISSNSIQNSQLAIMAPNSIKGNNTGGAATAQDLTAAQVAALFSAPNVQVLTSAGTYTTPANAKYLIVEMVGAGAGGGGGGTGGGVGTVGGNTTFGTSLLTANGGAGGTAAGSATGGAGGSATGGNIINLAGSAGFVSSRGTTAGASGEAGGAGAASFFGSAGNPVGGSTGGSATGFGSGGAGGGISGAVVLGTGGGAGAYIKHILTSLNATYSYSVGAGGGGGTAGTTGSAGGSGANGTIVVYAYFQ